MQQTFWPHEPFKDENEYEYSSNIPDYMRLCILSLT